MLIYEITAIVATDSVAEYERYMVDRHIPDVLATGRFAAAFIARNGNEYRIGYHCNSQADMDQYFANDAEHLRADFESHFRDKVSITRNVLDIVALFPRPE